MAIDTSGLEGKFVWVGIIHIFITLEFYYFFFPAAPTVGYKITSLKKGRITNF